ncbi:hypothetical protein JCM19233_3553 [Vibrio astriarenae]|nr:hypothetical protein JCM19233_3553 [Vibrio sp. C7]
MLNREGYQLLNNKPRSIQCSWRRMPWELVVKHDLPVQYNVLAMWRVMPYIWDIYRTQRFSLGRKDRDNIPDASAISLAQRLRISTLAADCHNNGNTLAHVITFILAELGIEYRPTNHQISSGMERKFQMHTDDESWMTDVFLPAHAAFDWDKAMSAVNVNHDAGKWTDLRQFLSASMLKLNVAQNEQRVGEYPEVKDEERVFIRKAPDGRKSRKNVFGERVQA